MRNYFVAFVLICMFFSACEQDTICLLDTTPNLIVVFKDKDAIENKKSVTSLTVWAHEKDSILIQQNTDSIAIPLNLNDDLTTYHFANSSLSDEFTFVYSRTDEFVSRSCGYKTLFSNLSVVNPTTNWISSYEIQNTTVENELTTHITFYH